MLNYIWCRQSELRRHLLDNLDDKPDEKKNSFPYCLFILTH